jgi:hypothetical protein
MIHCFIFLVFGMTTHSFTQSDSIIRWSPDRKLTYSDFIGQRPTAEMSHDNIDTLAAISCSIRYVLDTKNGKWFVRAYAFVNLRKSWMDVKIPYVLKHEQGHFDITEIYSRRFEKEVNDTSIADVHDYYAFVNEKLRQTFQSLDEENKKYDSYTMNTLGREYYYKWINEQLIGQPK